MSGLNPNRRQDEAVVVNKAFEKLKWPAVYSDGLGLVQIIRISKLSTISHVSLCV